MPISIRAFPLLYFISRCSFVCVVALLMLQVLPFGPQGPASARAGGDPLTFSAVVEKARILAAEPYEESKKISPRLQAIGYDAWRDIRFKPERALWKKSKIPFRLQFFHPGNYYDHTVKINEVIDGNSFPVGLTGDSFDYGKNTDIAGDMAGVIAPAGFRVHSPINTKDYFDEFLVFLGASYFRAIPKDGHYGLSARGLAVNTASPDGEEFPWFREFWILKPKPGDKDIHIFAILDSESLTGAYSFRVQPGQETVMDVHAELFFREDVEKLGLAPLTSMYLYGENSKRMSLNDYRPEVHDSDGLLLASRNGEWLWRPLRNPVNLQIIGLQTGGVKGFGLMQRDRDFNNYQDLETHYERRPSVWIEPENDWGPGRVELVEIPTDQEIHDNVVAYFVPAKSPVAGDQLSLDYKMRWLEALPANAGGGMAAASREFTKDETRKGFVVDFVGEKLNRLGPDAPMEGVVSVEQGASLQDVQVFKNEETGGWRLVFTVTLDESSPLERMLPYRETPIEIRAFLRNAGDVLTETWSYTVESQ